MIDKLYLRTEHAINAMPPGFHLRESKDRLYERCRQISWQNPFGEGTHSAFVKTMPTFSTRFRTRIELNPAKISSLEEIKWLLEHLGPAPDEMQIARLDHCADIHVPLQNVLQGLHVARKRRASEFSSSRPTGVYFGKAPEQVTAYLKATSRTSETTRLEVRQWAEKCAIDSLGRIDELGTYDPFKGIKHYRLKDESEVTKAYRNQYGDFAIQLETAGFHSVMAKSRRQRNFRREVGNYFVESGLLNSATAAYQQNVRQFLSGQWQAPNPQREVTY